MVGVGLVVDLGDPALLGTHRRGEVPEVIGRKRDVGRERLAHRLAVLVTLRYGKHLGVLIDRIRNVIQDGRTLGRGSLPPFLFGRVGGVEGKFDVLRTGMRDLAEHLARRRSHVPSILPCCRSDPLTTDEIVVALPERHWAARRARRVVSG